MAKSRQTGDLVSQNNLFVDTANDRIGIGTTNPQFKLQVEGDFEVGSGSTEVIRVVYSGTNIGVANTFFSGLRLGGDTEHFIGYGTTSAIPGVGGNLDTTLIQGRNTEIYAFDNVRIRSGTSDNIIFHAGTGSPERVRITSTGNVGIGTINPTSRLHVISTDPEVILVDRSNANNSLIQYRNTSGSMYAGLSVSATGWGVDSDNNLATNPHLLVLRDGGEVLVGSATSTGTASQKLQVTGGAYVSGNVGIGTTNPTNKLEVYGDIGVGTSYNHRLDGQNSNAYNIGFDSTSALIWGLQTSGGITTTLTITGWGDNNAYFDHRNNGDIYFRSGPSGSLPTSSSLVFKSGGSLLIGTATSTGTASQKLQVIGGGYFSGSVGIGTTNPQGQLHISSGTSGDCRLILEADTDNNNEGDNPFIIFRQDGGLEEAAIWQGNTTGDNDNSLNLANAVDQGPAGIRFLTTSNSTSYVDAVERMCILPTGNVGIGTRNPDELLKIVSNNDGRIEIQGRGMANSEYTMIQIVGYAATQSSVSRSAFLGTFKHSGILYPQPFLFLEEQDGTNIYFWVDNTNDLRTSGTITHLGTTSGTVVGDQTSDERLKNILGEVPYGLEEIKNINPVRYSMKREPDRERIGFIAQQVQTIVPESVYDTNDLIPDHEDEPSKLAMEYVALIPVLVNAVKELSAEVESLKAQLESINT